MLAVITTAAVAFAVIGLFSFVFFLLNDVFRVFQSNTGSYQEDGLPADESFFGDTQTDNPDLFVAYQFPHLVDTNKQIFVIPVTHQTEYEIWDDYSRKVASSVTGSYEGYNYSYNSSFINLLIYNAISHQVEKLFREQIIIGNYKPVYFSDDILLVFEAANKDTDGNKKINFNDNTCLFIYSFENKSLKQVNMEGKTLLDYRFIAKTKDLIVRFGKKPNVRGKKEKEFDAGVLCKYSYEKDELTTINDVKLNAELKKIAEGESK